jgi:hypothetical protein
MEVGFGFTLLPLHIRMSQGRRLGCLHDQSAEPVLKMVRASVLRSSAFRSHLKPNERPERREYQVLKKFKVKL